jgi:hypothetical protein
LLDDEDSEWFHGIEEVSISSEIEELQESNVVSWDPSSNSLPPLDLIEESNRKKE